MIPIAEPALKRRLIRILETYFNDETQASRILPNGNSIRLTKPTRGKGLRAQEHFYQQAKKAAKAREHERAMTFEPHRPAD
jgi:polyphosphate kinase